MYERRLRRFTFLDPQGTGDLEGNLVRQFGRVGEGPGEFSGGGTSALTVCSDDRFRVLNLVVPDQRDAQ